VGSYQKLQTRTTKWPLPFIYKAHWYFASKKGCIATSNYREEKIESRKWLELIADDKNICIFTIYDIEQYGEAGYQW